ASSEPANRNSSSETREECEQRGARRVVQTRETVARAAALPVVRQDRVRRGGRPPVVEQRRVRGQAPQGRGAHLSRSRGSLRNSVAEAAHVVQEEVRIRVEDLAMQRLP